MLKYVFFSMRLTENIIISLYRYILYMRLYKNRWGRQLFLGEALDNFTLVDDIACWWQAITAPSTQNIYIELCTSTLKHRSINYAFNYLSICELHICLILFFFGSTLQSAKRLETNWRWRRRKRAHPSANNNNLAIKNMRSRFRFVVGWTFKWFSTFHYHIFIARPHGLDATHPHRHRHRHSFNIRSTYLIADGTNLQIQTQMIRRSANCELWLPFCLAINLQICMNRNILLYLSEISRKSRMRTFL